MEMIEQMGVSYFIQFVIEVYNEIILIILITAMGIGIRNDKTRNVYKKLNSYTNGIIIFYGAIFLYNLVDCLLMLNLVVRHSLSAHIFMHEVLVFVYYAIGVFLTWFCLQFVKVHLAEHVPGGRLKKILTGVQFLLISCVILLCITPYTNILYYIDADNAYQRSYPGFWIWNAISIVSFAVVGFAAVIYWKYAESFLRSLLIVVSIFSVAGFLFNNYVFDFDVNNIVVILEALIIFFLYEKQKSVCDVEMRDLQTELMVSQIQPHFLYNSLTSIIYYIDKDPKLAEQSLIVFSRYLRHNLNAIREKDLIRFEEELDHMKLYLALEKLRFGNALEIVYEVEDLDFMLPVLTVQPLVENAVKHGIRKSDEGKGTVALITKKTEQYHVIEVRDDGAGFDASIIADMKNKHTGINNVKRCIEQNCNGELEIQSTIGQGTTCTIRIPC